MADILPFRIQVEEIERRIMAAPLMSGGGDGTFDPMEPRVRALEAKFDKVDSKLDSIGSDLAYIKGRLDSMPNAAAFGELKGRVDSLPTTGKIASVMAIIGGVVTVILKAPEILAFLQK